MQRTYTKCTILEQHSPQVNRIKRLTAWHFTLKGNEFHVVGAVALYLQLVVKKKTAIMQPTHIPKHQTHKIPCNVSYKSLLCCSNIKVAYDLGYPGSDASHSSLIACAKSILHCILRQLCLFTRQIWTPPVLIINCSSACTHTCC